jgi:hypothetical protein
MRTVYLSAPYTTGPDAPEKRQSDIDLATAWIMKLVPDVFVYSPITYQRRIKDIWGENGTWEFWGPRDGELVSRCDEVWVLNLRNWQSSRGVNFEIERARALGKPVLHVLVDTDDAGGITRLGLPDGRSISIPRPQLSFLTAQI